MIPVRRKYPNEMRTLTFDFASKLNTGDAVTTVDSLTASAGLTLGSSTVSGNTVSVQASGGSAGSDYTVHCRVNTSQLDKLQLDVTVEVREDAN